MKNNKIFIMLISTLVIAGSYGVYSIFQQQQSVDKKKSTTQPIATNAESEELSKETSTLENYNKPTRQTVEVNDYHLILTEVTDLLDQAKQLSAIKVIDSAYQQLSTNELEKFEQLFITEALTLWELKKASEAITLLTLHNEIFDGVEGLRLLGNIHLAMENWQAAINTLLETMSREYRPDKLQDIISKLTNAANSQRLILESQKDELAINAMYRNLYESHPNIARFQFELGSSYLRLSDEAIAKSLLEPLQYDTDYAAVAGSALASINSNSVAVIEKPVEIIKKSNDIFVPLQRSGNSFVATTNINNRELRLLLDTGASITALSKETIQSLNLKPTGRSIQLSTANGLTQAKLYRADKIRLGRLTYNGLVVAEIEFGKNSQIHGLLGTDLLNQINNRYSYVIDNEKNALIFKPKN